MMKVVFVASEVVPFAKTGGLADVAGALPLALEKFGCEVSIFLPRYPGVESAGFEIKKLDNGLSTARIGRGVEVFFVEHDDYFRRNGLYGDQKGDFKDNLERFQFFCVKVLQVLDNWKEPPDIIHCHDWQTALIPVYLRAFPRQNRLRNTKTVFTIHNIAYQGIFPKDKVPKLNLDHNQFFQLGMEYFGQINLLKSGIVNSDVVSTVSPQYADEIQTKAYGCGLDGVLRARQDKVLGILNGIDGKYWDPQTDRLIPYRYSGEDIERKLNNKAVLQNLYGFATEPKVPLFGFVGRLAQQKGLDLLAGAMEILSRMDLQIAILGVGDQKYQDMLRHLSTRFSAKLRLLLKFDEEIAHQIYAGSDFFLMPSQYEPCGLSQMISLRYGTIPVVYKTGGLADTIQSHVNGGNGFVFEHYSKESFSAAISEALMVYGDSARMTALVKKAFTYDFAWENSAQKYTEIYEKLLGR